ncbi:MAG: ribosome biogenesis GTP-binding protein YihA/YsxC [Clostridia bacterium]|nr:ribosome biogenesis GTP-binding protein YihA/YsxC [Clostridia bacterium]
MNVNNAVFEAAFGTAEQLPVSDLDEYCFSGRSNVGKSSLINKILNRKSIARVSQTPGKTITVNFYRCDDKRLVDLPGYGYAKVTYAEKERWSELMETYFNSARNIKMCFQLIDMRHNPADFDVSMLEFLADFGIPYTIVLTKCDKLNKTEFCKQLEEIKAYLGDLCSNVAVIPFSALKGNGVNEILEIIG